MALPDPAPAALLLDRLHVGGEFRYLWQAKPTRRTTWARAGEPLPDVSSARDIYFGVHPTARIPERTASGEPAAPEHVRGRIEDIAAVNCLFAEFDGKDFEGGLAGAMAHIQSLRPPPSAVVSSGGGFHCYWLLREPWLLADDAERARAAALQAAWVGRVGGDPGAKDLARVLRVPGTVNTKYASLPTVDLVLWMPQREYAPEDFPAPEPEPEPPPPPTRAPAPMALGDQEVVERMMRSREGAQVGALMAGDSSGHGGDESAADLALANHLVFWSGGDVAQADRIFRTSGRMRPKWDEVHGADGRTYGQMTLDKAMEGRTAFYRAGAGGNGHATPTATDEFDGVSPAIAAQLEKRPGLPTIYVNGRHLRDISADALAALMQWNRPARLFLRAGKLVRVLTDERGRPAIYDVSDHCLRGALCRAANFAKTEVRGRGEAKTVVDVIVHPPMEVVRDILALGEWEVPALEGIIESPVVRPDGTVLSTPGYDDATRLYYHRGDLRLADVPQEPSPVDVELAKQALLDLACDFPFVDEASRANWLGLMLTPILRPAIDGPVPIALIDAPMAGTGKSLLAEVVSLVATGAPAEMLPHPKEDGDEMRKKITGLLTKGAGMICIDNVTGEIESPDLALALTGRLWSDRALGGNQIVTVPQRAVWVATGNNLRVAGDMGRRCYWIRMDAKLSDPEQRSKFKYPHLTAYALERRGYLLACALTVARNWFARGRPKAAVPRMGSFEAWCEVVGGALHACGVTEFLGNLKEMRANADEERGEWEAFLRAWHSLYGSSPKPLSEVVFDLAAGGELRSALPLRLSDKVGSNGFSRSLGKALSARQGTRYGADGIHLEKGGGDLHNKVSTWKVLI